MAVAVASITDKDLSPVAGFGNVVIVNTRLTFESLDTATALTPGRKRLPFFASILYASNPELLRAMGGRLGRHLLFRHGVLATLAELRVVKHRRRLSLMLRSPRPKMFKSAHLAADQIDYLYSELVCVAW